MLQQINDIFKKQGYTTILKNNIFSINFIGKFNDTNQINNMLCTYILQQINSKLFLHYIDFNLTPYKKQIKSKNVKYIVKKITNLHIKKFI